MRPFITTFFVLFSNVAHLASQEIPPKNVQKYNLGKLEKTASPDLVIPFKNSTKSVAHIDSVQDSCTCLYSDFEPKTLNPGELGYLNVTINLASKRGYFLEEVVLHTNQLDNSIIRFQFLGYVLSDIEVEPTQVFILVPDSKIIEPIKIILESTKAPLQEAELYDVPEWLAYKKNSIGVKSNNKSDDLDGNKENMKYKQEDGYGEPLIIEKPVIEITRKLIQFEFDIIEEKLPKEKAGSEKIFFRTNPSSLDPVFLTINWQRENDTTTTL